MTRIASGRAAATPQISGHQDGLDGVRAVAALLVLVFHVALNAGVIARQVTAGWVFNGGQAGVAIFFALSGLLLYRPWAHAALGGRTAPGAGRYLFRRALRVLPAYWLLVVVVMLVVYREHLGDARSWLGLLTLTHIYDPQDWWNSPLGPREMGQAWSLAVEAAWYVALPPTAALLARFTRRGADVAGRARRLLIALGGYALVSFAFTVVMFVPEHRPSLGIWPPRYTAWFAIGMALAVLTVWAKEEPWGAGARFCRTVAASWGACWLAALSLLVISASPITGPLDLGTASTLWTSLLHIAVYGLCAAFFVAPVALAPAGHPVMDAVLGNPLMRWLGRISYGVFLWQMAVILAWYEATGRLFRGSLLTDLPLLVAVSVLAGAVSYYAVEHPAQRLGRIGGGRTAPAPR
ncbi:Peptidoglycan/LPS O-acetylase OafA/YrhL, contains acyltransferase and SGNH-hydrolase domains [Thermomonospora echinospora]|uniref:Peptidoglycan/LPS O-acetylase OafA/YrhL, contains acyltransferase and SGNH-hydrolase domains n=1 Tax=Thermomonospora echinospora TaxID=1992 RepID=A0A1H5W4E8_9ACTN|nr:acyltransferase [Thermomonospora echinospora]SEF94379.1 Peptidoglycan/LPS O-acetylase OafA/YrhL, contains acyltransferase and SGNH-hydrolase domains [Thermomonospora echinospora]